MSFLTCNLSYEFLMICINITVCCILDWVILSHDLLLCIVVFFFKYFNLLRVVTESDLLLIEMSKSSWISSYAHVTDKINKSILKRDVKISSLNILLDILTDVLSVINLCTEVTHDFVTLCCCSNIWLVYQSASDLCRESIRTDHLQYCQHLFYHSARPDRPQQTITCSAKQSCAALLAWRVT